MRVSLSCAETYRERKERGEERTVWVHDGLSHVYAEFTHVVGKGELAEVDAGRGDLDACRAELFGLCSGPADDQQTRARIQGEENEDKVDWSAPAARGGRPVACSSCAE